MPSLDPEDISRTRFHLGYSAMDSIPDGDEQRLVLAVSRIRDNQTIQYIRFVLGALDDTYNLLMGGGTFDSRQILAGDINRSTVVETPDDWRKWNELYLKKTDDLAMILNVANFRRPTEARYRFQRLGSVSVFPAVGHPSGVSDTVTISKVDAALNYS